MNKKRWNLKRPIWLRLISYMPAYALAGWCFLALMNVFVGFVILHPFKDGFGTFEFIMGLICLPISIFFLYLAFSIFRSQIFTQIYFNSDGVSYTEFGKVKIFLLWEELAEVGIALDGSINESLYFSKRVLEDFNKLQIDHLDNLQTEDRPIHEYYIRIRNMKELKKACPIPVPAIKPTSFLKSLSNYFHGIKPSHDLICYRRDRNENGIWRLPMEYKIFDAEKTIQLDLEVKRDQEEQEHKERQDNIK